MSIAIKKTCEIIEKLRETHSKSWLEMQCEVEEAGIKQGNFEPLYVGYEDSPYRMRFVPQKQLQIISKKFDEELNRIGKEHSLVVQMRCTGYNLFKDTGETQGLGQKIRSALGMAHGTRLLRVMYLELNWNTLNCRTCLRLLKRLEDNCTKWLRDFSYFFFARFRMGIIRSLLVRSH